MHASLHAYVCVRKDLKLESSAGEHDAIGAGKAARAQPGICIFIFVMEREKQNIDPLAQMHDA